MAALLALAALMCGVPAQADDRGLALICDRVIPVDGEGTTYAPGMIVAKEGHLQHVGEVIDVGPGYERVELGGWAVPGMVDLHSHAVTDGWGGINDMVLPVNAELSVAPTVRPSNRKLRLACASGVTTLFLIPGSGTSMGGTGVLFKTRTDAGYERSAMADPGGMKVAQTHNPERRAGDLGSTRAGLYWILERAIREATSRAPREASAFRLADLRRVMQGELPVLVHCAGSDGVASAARMWRVEHPTRSVLSHGSFDGWRVADYLARVGMPVNHGPRTQDYRSSRTGRIVPTAKIYATSGVPDFSLNTDAPVVPAEEFFLQGTMTARQGLDGRRTLRALTSSPARAFGIDGSVGSLEVGKDADIVVFDGDPLDPRSRVERVYIEGDVQYDRRSDGQWL